ncbi:hypothetical protein VitviT2T_013356 [Vitis vinifera]|uniref:Avr9/Cf-9 rapidly elicited protein 146 n=2 Tax=Vitis vinifera TaxID=29760 RepID=F6HYB0_VITVI|nr:uncharacterized protein LOC100248099 [Vitis vinifera]RVW76783.1 hypothetical protein CK203_050530 [Vitis vinifera]WJZ94508.1 hypothetical protein VitviT2T_013356 [Vitis vinifera]|eukprot:XP_002283976.1 PREDICTED: uncharacterized protein LOC100248099 [Vitis vinifera]
MEPNPPVKMEPNLPGIAKRLWGIVRVMFFMLRKGISKRKLLLDLNMMMKRGKIAGKAIGNLMFHHHSSSAARRSADGHISFAAPREYEFSCSNSPAYPYHFPFNFNKRKHNHHNIFSCVFQTPPTSDDDFTTVNAVKAVLEMLNSEVASPALPGFGRSPMVRQLRITDSPFPLKDIDEDSEVDKAAEEFIERFYNDLKKQKMDGSLSR